jgi:hypothetical protein
VYGLQFEKFFGTMSPIKSKSALGCIRNNHFFTGKILPKSTHILAPSVLLKEIQRKQLHKSPEWHLIKGPESCWRVQEVNS